MKPPDRSDVVNASGVRLVRMPFSALESKPRPSLNQTVLVKLAYDVCGQAAEAGAGLGQRHRLSRAIDEDGADPILQRFDAPAECRLGGEAKRRRSGEVARLRQAEKILEPFQFHDQLLQGICRPTSVRRMRPCQAGMAEGRSGIGRSCGDRAT